MFLCKSGDGFNFTTSRAIGYPWLLEYMAGHVYNQTDSGKSIKWQFPSKCREPFLFWKKKFKKREGSSSLFVFPLGQIMIN